MALNPLGLSFLPSLTLAVLLALPPSLMAATLTVPDARGTYTLSGTVTESNCSIPSDNGTDAISGMLTIISQTGANFSGSGTFIEIKGGNTDLTEIMVTGDIDVSGQFSGTFTFISTGCSSVPGSGTFSGSLAGNVITVALAAQSDCTVMVSMSGSRLSPGTGPASAPVPDARGTYTLSGTVTNSNCPIPSDNGTDAISGMLTIISQTGANFSGLETIRSSNSFLVEITLTGGIDASGQFSGTFTFISSGCDSNSGSDSGSGTFSGSLAGNAITVAFTVQSDCTVMGSSSGSRLSPGTGPVSAMVTDLGDTGAPGQLRTLVTAAAPGDTIVIPVGTIVLTAQAGGSLDITKTLTLQGAGPDLTIIDGGGIDRVIETSGGTVIISGVSIRNGKAGTQGTSGEGITSNGSPAGVGGGISHNSLGPLIVMNTAVFGNSASEGGGGIAIGVGSGPVTLTNVTLSGNNTPLFGGGILNAGTMTLTNVTLSGNSAGVNGGGIASAAGSMTLTNVTLSGNSANTSGGGIFNQGGAVQLKNTIVANSPSGGNCSGTITSLGHNLDSADTCGFTGPGDLSNTAPQLGPLQNNGGPTQTHALLGGSPAIDAGTNTGCPVTDQRGFARPVDGDSNGIAICDIGAYEFGAADPTSSFVTRLYQTVLLREPDAPGLAAHVADIESFGTVIPTVLAFFHSEEFLSQPLTDDQFLDRLYHTFLNRPPDPAGLQAFQDLLVSGCRTRDTLIAALTFSDEFKSLVPPLPVADLRVPFVAELYAWILNRPPDPALQGWVTQLQRSTALATVLSFLHSPEFTTPRRDTATYVNSLYLAFLGRPPDCGGLTFWVTTLTQQGDTDAARDQVAGQFAGSDEFQGILARVFPTTTNTLPPNHDGLLAKTRGGPIQGKTLGLYRSDPGELASSFAGPGSGRSSRRADGGASDWPVALSCGV